MRAGRFLSSLPESREPVRERTMVARARGRCVGGDAAGLALLMACFLLAVLAAFGASEARGAEQDWTSRLINPNRQGGEEDFRLPIHGMCDRDAIEAKTSLAKDASLSASHRSTMASLGNIGQTMDRIDLLCVTDTLEHADDGHSILWANPAVDAAYVVTLVRTFRESHDQVCRDYALKAFIGDVVMETYRTACRLPKGDWQPAVRRLLPETSPRSTSG